MDFLSRGAHSSVSAFCIRARRTGPFVLLAVAILGGTYGSLTGQPVEGDLLERPAVVSPAVSLSSLDARFVVAQDDRDNVTGNGGWNRRQALLIGGLAGSMAAYGYFILEFNNSRGDASVAERAYEEDVRQNAQTYVDQGIELDDIQTFRDWQAAYDDAKRSREWAARAGFLAIVIGFFAVLDAATTYDAPPPSASSLTVRPQVSLSPIRNDLLVGARLRF